MVQTRELIAALDQELVSAAFGDGQHNGLQVEGTSEIDRILTSVSVSMETIRAAVDGKADALLTHHGLLWHNQPLHVQGVRRRRLALLLESDINLITYHLPLDAHPTLGNNAALADAAGVQGHPAFAYKGATIGVQGELPSPQPFAAWARGFEEALRRDCNVATGPFQIWPFGPEQVRSVGFVSGAAPYQVQDAIDAGLDVYVTGEPAEGIYHLAKEAGIHVIAAGHYLSERGGIQRLGRWCAERFGTEHQFFDVATEV